MNPNPLFLPVSLSVSLVTEVMLPNCEKYSRSCSSSWSSFRPPTKIFLTVWPASGLPKSSLGVALLVSV